MSPTVSIVIPAFAASESALSRLMRLFESIASQSFNDVEVVVSDHSLDDRVETYLQNFPLRIKYIRNHHDFGNSSANTNLALSMVEGEFIQVMHCDDWYSSRDAIALLVQELNRLPRVHWGVFAFDHWDEESDQIYSPLFPSMERTLGNPSTTFFRRNCIQKVTFDCCLININDHDFHQSLLFSFGPPIIVRELCVRIGMSDSNVAKTLSQKRLLQEMRYHEQKWDLQYDNLWRDYKIRVNRQQIQSF